MQVFREQSGAAALSGRELPPDETLAAYAHVTARAAEYKESGAFPGVRMDQLRATAYLDLINGVTPDARIALARLSADAPDPESAPSTGTVMDPENKKQENRDPHSPDLGEGNPEDGEPGGEPAGGRGPGGGDPGSSGRGGRSDPGGDHDTPASGRRGPRGGSLGDSGLGGSGKPGGEGSPDSGHPVGGRSTAEDAPGGQGRSGRKSPPVNAQGDSGRGRGDSGETGAVGGGAGDAEPEKTCGAEVGPGPAPGVGSHQPTSSPFTGRPDGLPVLANMTFPLATLLGLATGPARRTDSVFSTRTCAAPWPNWPRPARTAGYASRSPTPTASPSATAARASWAPEPGRRRLPWHFPPG